MPRSSEISDLTLRGEISFEEMRGALVGYVVFHELGHAITYDLIYRDAKGEYVAESILEPDDLEIFREKFEALEKYLDSITIWE